MSTLPPSFSTSSVSSREPALQDGDGMHPEEATSLEVMTGVMACPGASDQFSSVHMQ